MKIISKIGKYRGEGLKIIHLLPEIQLSKDEDGAYGVKIGWLTHYLLTVLFTQKYIKKHEILD